MMGLFRKTVVLFFVLVLTFVSAVSSQDLDAAGSQKCYDDFQKIFNSSDRIKILASRFNADDYLLVDYIMFHEVYHFRLQNNDDVSQFEGWKFMSYSDYIKGKDLINLSDRYRRCSPEEWQEWKQKFITQFKDNQSEYKSGSPEYIAYDTLIAWANAVPETKREQVATASPANTNGDIIVYVTQTGDKYHRSSCSSLRKSKIARKLSEAATRYGPCSQCNPPRL